jgi:hypothetical protein
MRVCLTTLNSRVAPDPATVLQAIDTIYKEHIHGIAHECTTMRDGDLMRKQ